MKKILFAAILTTLLSPFCAIADSVPEEQLKPRSDANIMGHVQNAETHEHIPYVNITIKGTTIGVTTDGTGHYFLKNLPVGDFTVVASSVGYRKSEQRIRTVAGKTIELNFLLQQEAVGIDGVVVSATRNETSKRESGTIVNVASARLFETTASVNLAETMVFQPGLRVENNCGNCGVTQLRINGLEGQYTQVLLDSRPIFSSLAGVYGLEQLPVSMIERVEVVRGGGSALFGSSAIGGVVNIITKEPLRNTMSLSNTTNIFEDGKLDLNTSFNGSFVSDDHRAGVYLFGMVRDRDHYDRNGDGFSELPKLESETVGFRGYYRTGMYSRLTAEYHHIHEFRRGGNRFDQPPHETDITEQIDHKINGGGVTFEVNSPDYRNRGSVYASGQHIRRNSYYGAEFNQAAYGKTGDVTLVAGGQYTHSFGRLWFMPAELTAGFEYTHNDLDDKILRIDRNLRQTTNIVGGYIQNEWKTERWGLLIGARLDKHNLIGNAVLSPRATLRYSPSESIGLRASYSSGYRAPQAYDEDLHVEAVSEKLKVIEIEEGLRPEYSHSVSASVDLYHNFGRLQTNFLAEGFYTYLDDVFALKEGRVDEEAGIAWYTRYNGSGATIAGVNMEAKLGIPGRFEVQLGYTFQRSRYREPEDWSEGALPAQRRMFRAPDSYGYFTSNFNVARNFTASLFGTYTGPMLVQHLFEDVHSERVTPHFFDAGVKLSYNFRLTDIIGLEVNAGVKNILDSYQEDIDYGPSKDAGYVYGPSLPRIFFVGLKFSM